MFICNIKLDENKLFKIFFIIIFIIIFILFSIAIYRIFNKNITVNDEMQIPESANLSASNYTNVLKAVHENLDMYVGQKIHFIGYVYRAIDFSEEEFVLARDMIIGENQQSLIVGFLCKSKEIKKYSDKTWIEITGIIQKGIYHDEVPVIEVIEIKQVEKPIEEFVSPPDECYIPTSILF